MSAGNKTQDRQPRFGRQRRPRAALIFVLLSLLLLLVAAIRLMVGSYYPMWPTVELSPDAQLVQATKRAAQDDEVEGGAFDLLHAEHPDWTKQRWALAEVELNHARRKVLEVLRERLFRLTAAAVVGLALATSGVSLQALLRNPLAEPFILGISTGAGVGIMVQQLLGHHLMTQHVGALAGAAITMLIVLLASRKRGTLDPLGMLLTGVVLGTINGATIMILNYVVGPAGLNQNLARWMMGYIDTNNLGWMELALVGGICGMGMGILLWQARAMDLATLSDVEAISLGVHLARLRLILFLVASILASAAVVLAGPIAFVGLICPHIGRLLLGPRHLSLLVASAILGAILIIVADTTSAALNQKFQIGLLPIGIMTALLGGPMFLWMLRPKLGRDEL